MNNAEHEVRRFDPSQITSAKDYFNEYGYVVFSNAFSIVEGESFWSDVERAIADEVRFPLVAMVSSTQIPTFH